MSSNWKRSAETGKEIGKKNRKKCVDDPMKCGMELGLKVCKGKKTTCKRKAYAQSVDCLQNPRDCAEALSDVDCSKKYKESDPMYNNCNCNAYQKINPTANPQTNQSCRTLHSTYKKLGQK